MDGPSTLFKRVTAIGRRKAYPSSVRFEHLLGKLSLLRERDSRVSVFGSSSHRYTLNPPIEAERLATLEQNLDIRVPEPYRAFLLEVGNGGAGPSYGLLRLEDALYKEVFHPNDPDPPPDDFLSRPFVPPEEYDKSDLQQPGALPMSHHGCGHFAYLIISGNERGAMWDGSADGIWIPVTKRPLVIPSFSEAEPNWEEASRRIGNEHLAYTRGSGRNDRFNFEQWYLRWIQESLDSLSEG